MKTVLQIIPFIFLSFVSTGQVSVKGKVVAPDGAPIPFANILILNSGDSTLVEGTVSDVNGAFYFERIETGNYVVQVRSIGYTTSTSPLEIRSDAKEIDLGINTLTEDTKTLNEVIVHSDRPLYQQELDKMTINVQSSALTKGSSILEVLERSPGVIYDRYSNNIMLNGKRGVGVLINGKLIQLSPAEIANMLNGMTADNIESIDIITNPSAKYDAEGLGGLINIKVKKNEENGTNGSSSISSSYGLFPKAVASANINHRKDKFNLYGNYSYAYDKNPMLLTAQGTFRFPHESPETNRTSDYRNERTTVKKIHNATVGFDYAVGKNTTLGANSIFSVINQLSKGDTYSKYALFEDSLQVFEVDISEKNDWKNSISNINLEQKIGTKGKLNADVDYLYYKNINPSNYLNSFRDKEGNEIQAVGFLSQQLVENETPINIFVYRGSYEYQLNSRIRIEAGFKLSTSQLQNSLRLWEDDGNGELKRNDAISSRMKLNESINAVFTSVDFNLEKIKLNIGLRHESTSSDVAYQEEPEKNFARKYGNLFPSVFLTRNIGERENIQLSYNRRINRPSFTLIAPSVTFNDIYSIVLGNPALRPSVTDNIKAQYQWKDALFSLELSNYKNQIIDFQHIVSPSDSLFYIQSLNLKSQQTVWWQTSFPVQIMPRWRMQSTVLVGWKQFEATGIVEQSFKKSLFLFNAYNTHSIELPAQLAIEVSAYYYTADYNGSYKRKAFGALNVGVKKELKNNLGTLQLSFPDVLKSTRYPLYIEPGLAPYGLSSNIYFRPESNRSFLIRIGYSKSFGNSKVKGLRKQRSTSDESNRLK